MIKRRAPVVALAWDRNQLRAETVGAWRSGSAPALGAGGRWFEVQSPRPSLGLGWCGRRDSAGEADARAKGSRRLTNSRGAPNAWRLRAASGGAIHQHRVRRCGRRRTAPRWRPNGGDNCQMRTRRTGQGTHPTPRREGPLAGLEPPSRFPPPMRWPGDAPQVPLRASVCGLRFGHGSLSCVRAREPGRGELLLEVRGADDRNGRSIPRRAQGGHGAVCGPGGLHLALRAPGPRGRARPALPVLRAPAQLNWSASGAPSRSSSATR